MADWGIKIVKPGKGDVKTASLKDLIILSTAEAHKAIYNGQLSSSQNYFAHGLGFIPFFEAYIEDSNGDFYPVDAYIDDQFYSSIYTYVTTSNLYVSQYLSGQRVRHYTIYLEDENLS
jgi:hypothetical protein